VVVFTSRVACRVRTAWGRSPLLATERRNFVAREQSYLARFARPGRSVRAALIGTTALVAASLAAAPARAQSVWNGSTSGVWNTDANWTPSGAPTATGTATFGASQQHNVTFSPTTTSVGTLEINTGLNNYSFNLTSSPTPGQTLSTGGIVDSSSGIVSFSGGTVGGTITQNGPGTLIFNSAGGSSATVNGGTLELDGSIAGVIAVNSGTLDGTGTGGGGQNIQIGRATLMPGTAGNPTGSLTVAGNLFLSSVSTYVATLNGTGSSSTNVLGTATLSGTFSAAATPGSTYSASDLFSVINAGSFKDGFTQFKTSGSFGNVVPYLIYNANNLQVGFTAGTAWMGTTATNGNLWSNAASWAGGAVPAQGGAVAATTVATFGSTSGTPQVTINSAASANTILLTSSATAPFTFTINAGGSLLLTSLGIDNNSAFAPVFNVGNATGGSPALLFQDGASAGNAQIINSSGGATSFGGNSGLDTASAGTATITNNSGGATTFSDSTSADAATITTNSGGTLTFTLAATAGNATIITNSGGTTSFAAISGSGNATFVTNSGGVVSFTTAGPSGDGAMGASAIYDTDGKGGQIVFATNGLTLTVTDGQGTFDGAISGNGALTIAGGTTTLTGANTYTGATTINGGTLAVDGTGGSITSAVTVNLGGTLTGSGTVNGGVTVNSGGTLSTGANGSGTLKVSGNLTQGFAANYTATLNGSGTNTATLITGSSSTATLAGTFTAIAGSASTTYSTSDLYTVLTTAAANGVKNTFTGLTVSGNFGNVVPYLIYNSDTHNDNVQVGLTAGNIWKGAANAPWSVAGSWTNNIAPTAGTGLASVAAFTSNGATKTVTIDTATAVAGTLLFDASGYNFTIGGNNALTISGVGIVDSSGSTTNAPTFSVGDGTGTSALNFTNAATAGDAVITTNSGGTTSFTDKSTGGSAQFNTASGGVVDFSGTVGPSVNDQITAGSIAGAGNYYLGSNTLTVGNSGSQIVSGVISNCAGTSAACEQVSGTGGSIVKVGSGILTLSGINTYTGSTTIDAGTLAIGSAGSIASSSQVAIATGATFDVSTAGASITTLADSASGQAGTVNLGTKTLTITSGSSTFSGSLNGSGALVINGGDQTLAGVSTGAEFFGTATINSGGTLTLAAANAIEGSAVTINSGGTLALGSYAESFISLALSGGTVEGGALSGTVASTGGTISSVGGNAAVNATGGTTTFTGGNTYSGTTTASNNGTILAAGGANSLSASSNVSLGSGTTLDLGSNNQTIASLNGSGIVTNLSNPSGYTGSVSPVLTITNGNSFDFFSGVISNGTQSSLATITGLDVAGGTVTLGGTSTYTGATTVGPDIAGDTAKLIIATGGSIANSSGVIVNSGGTLEGAGSGTSPAVAALPAVTVNAGGTLNPYSTTAPLTLSGSLVLNPGSNYEVTISGGNASEVSVTGASNTASIGGIFTAVAGGGTYSTSTPYTVLSTANASGVSGTFSGITIASGSNFGDYVPYLVYKANSVQLDLTQGTGWLGATQTGGVFNWNNTANWQGGVIPTASSSTPADTVATFNGTGSAAVAVNTTATASALLFTSTVSSPYTFTINGGGSLTLSGVGIDDNSGVPANAPIFSLGGATGGTLTFQNAATAGDAIINITSGGLLQFQGNSSGGTSQLSLSGTGVADFSGSLGPGNDGINGVASINSTIVNGSSGSIYLGDTTLVVSNGGTFAGTISDCGPTGRQCSGNANGSTGGSLVVNGGSLTLSGNNTYTGGTALNSGTLVVGTDTQYVGGVASGGIQSSAIGTGTLIFNGGTLQAGGAFTIANAVQITTGSSGVGGIIDADGHTFTLSGNITDNALSSGGTLSIFNSNSSTPSTVVFSGTNTYSGATDIGITGHFVTLAAGAANTLSPNSAITVGLNGTLDLGSLSQTVGALNGSGTVTSLSNPTGVTAPATAILIVNNGGSFSGTISDGSGAAAGVTTGLTIAGGGLTLSGASSALFTGATTIDSGANLKLIGVGFWLHGGVVNNGTLDVSNGGGAELDTLSGSSSSAVLALGNSELTIADGATPSVYNGSITGVGIIDIGSGTQAFNGNSSSFNGIVDVSAIATLQVGNNNAIGTSTLNLDGGTLQAGAAGLTVGNNIALDTSGTIDANGNTLTLSGVISGTDLTIKDSTAADTGIVILTAANAYTGTTTIGSGNLQLGTIGSSIGGTGVTVSSAGTLSGIGTVNAPVSVSGTLSPGTSGSPTGTLNITGNLTLTSSANYIATINGSNSSLTAVNGTATLDGTITIAGSGSGTSYTLLTSTSAITTQFSAVNITGNFGINLPTLSYSTPNNEVTLTFIQGNVWLGTTNSNWGPNLTNTNWTSGSAPTAAGTDLSTSVAAFTNNGAPTTIAVNTTTAVAGTLLFTSTSPGYTFNINGGNSLTLDGNGIVNQSTTTTPTFNVGTSASSTGALNFEGSSTAGNAIINTNAGGKTTFLDNSTGGSAQFNTLSGGTVDFSQSSGQDGLHMLSAGSIAGAGNYLLGGNQLTVGSNNLSTTVSGVISDTGGGSLNKVGTGTLTLSGTNTYTGGTTISSGTLQAANAGAIGGGPVTLNGGTFQVGSSFALPNAFNLNTTGGTIDTFGNTLTLSGGIVDGNGTTGTLTVASSTGSGTLDLTGANAYTGPTVVNSGTLLVDGSLSSSSSVTVNSGGTLGGVGTIGTGTLGAVDIGAGGTFMPGSATSSSSMPLTINGSLTLASAATYMVIINGNNSSYANVAGTATLGGSNLIASAKSTGIVVGQSYKVLQAGTVSGTFSTPVFNVQGTGLLDASVTYTGTTATATFQRAQIIPGVQPSIYNSLINSINNSSANGTLSPQFQNLFNLPAGQQTAALQQLSGQSNTGGVVSANSMQTSFATTLLNPGVDGRSGGFGGFGPVLGYAPEAPMSAEQQSAYDAVTPHDAAQAVMRGMNPEYNHSVWASAYGGYSSLTGTASNNLGTATATSGGGGIASGIDFRFGPDTVIGFALGGGGTSWNLTQGLGGGNSEIFQGGFYGSHRFGNFYISGALAFAYDWMHTNRTVTSPTVANLTASFQAPGATGRLEGGYNFDLGAVSVTPYVAGEFSALRVPGYTESGNPAFALSYQAATQTNERAELGVWAGKSFQLSSAILWLRGRAGYAHDWWSSDNFTTAFADLPTQSFTSTGITPPANVGLGSLMAEVKYPSGVSWSARFDAEAASSYYSLAGTGTFRYAW
jgi:fibronectin-binding autotransporter adhesin